MEEKKITPSDLRAEASRLLNNGKMPKLKDLLSTIAEARKKYVPALKAIREGDETEVNSLTRR
jgi:hypothetical protein